MSHNWSRQSRNLLQSGNHSLIAVSFNQPEIAAAQPAGNTEVRGHTDVTLINTRCQLANHCSLIVRSQRTGNSLHRQVKVVPSADAGSPGNK